MTGDSFHLLAIDLPLALVLVSPWLLIASTRSKRNAPLIVPALVLFVLGLSSLYVALIESPSTAHALQNLNAGSELLQHQHDLTFIALDTLLAATLMFVLGLLYWDANTTGFWRRRFVGVFTVFAAVYCACTLWLLKSAHLGAGLARHVSQHLRP
jgi:hypothetical protein